MSDVNDPICSVCRDIFRSPRFLPCYHSFCFECLKNLEQRHGNIIPCPLCRLPAPIPAGGVGALQVNFYFPEEVLEQTRREKNNSMCSVHSDERITLYCCRCDQAICMRCKVIKHEGHNTEDLSLAAARSKNIIEGNTLPLDDYLQFLIDNGQTLSRNKAEDTKARDSLAKQIRERCDVIVAWAEQHRDQALQQLDEISGNQQKDLDAADNRMQAEINTVINLRERVEKALGSTRHLEVLQVKKEMMQCDERQRGFEAVLPDTNYRYRLDCDFNSNVKNNIKKFIGSPGKVFSPPVNSKHIVRIVRCDDEKYCEVHGVREMEDKTILVFFGCPGNDFSQEKEMWFSQSGSKIKRQVYQPKMLSTLRIDHQISSYIDQTQRRFLSKRGCPFLLRQNCNDGRCYIWSLNLQKDKTITNLGINLCQPNVHTIHNFDSNKCGTLFVVIDERKTDDVNAASKATNLKQNDSGSSRVVRLYDHENSDPIATYTPPKQPFFPTDVCFCGERLLLIADWINDCMHVTKITDNTLTFIDYLPGCGNIVQPTALNLDLNGRLLIGCGDGWILKYDVDISGMYLTSVS